MKSLIDSNIIIYSLVPKSPYFKASRLLLKNEDELYVSIQNLIETFRVITSLKELSVPYTAFEAWLLINQFITHINLLVPREDTLLILQNLCYKYSIKSYQIYDTFLVSVMMDYGIDRIYTNNDKDFKKFSEIKVINPFK
ncbi:hypothetical protein COV24_01190 [candidate division WWE3 bacterium CG10_big_fil_rev_8_21_14_0_10_32_10]|uniref:PIN domain-containing protein n=1 Tax=candidate division WWE3 bacterium CG10_big_fil_rev_8_21_14_0_10_32_10 TaxID=1975090 RepID=A0A2H0RB39_UNCKA|nr:MAG: hypothetical protein COV24_01190 [candidate division WWE3 bacterium CG10_big_fil_rev_8_21_14_0_10_32_10]